MKNTTFTKLVIGLGLITSTIFMSCSKKSDNPNPSNTSNSITPNNNYTNDSLYTYLKQGDTTIINILNNKLWFLTKINGDTLETGDSLYTMRDYYDYNLHALNFTKLLICDKNLKQINFLKKTVSPSYQQTIKTVDLVDESNYNNCLNVMKNKDGLYLSSGNNYTSFTQNIIYHIKIINSKNIEIYIKNNNDTDTNKYTNKNIIRYKVI